MAKYSKALGLLVLSMLYSEGLFANPQNPVVISGEASFQMVDGAQLQIQASDRAIINWDAFSIEAGEITRFVQPGALSSVLNRVTTFTPSMIDGVLEANGQVYLVNPAGIVVGANGVINTASFVAAACDILDAPFLARGELELTSSMQAMVTNYGKIRAFGGDVLLLGFQIDNQGTIEALQGNAILAAGEHFLLQTDGNILIRPAASRIEATGIDHSGKIEAIRAELLADGNAYSLAIKHEGSIDALGVAERNGEVFLIAEEGLTQVAGSITAHNEQTGGDIQVLGKMVSLLEGASLDVTGASGGGTVLVGGDYQGNNPSIINSEYTWVGKGTAIHADALEIGNGGKVILWSDKINYFDGLITARGGSLGGDGGFVEVSGKENLFPQGHVDTSAPFGAYGTLLWDPCDVTISSAATTAGITPPPPYTCPILNPINFNFGALNSANIFVTDLSDALLCNNVVVNSSSGTGTGAGTIQVLNDVGWSSGTTLTLQAPANILVNASITNGTGFSGDVLILTAPTVTVGDGTQVGTAQLVTATGNIQITAQNGFSMTSGASGSTAANLEVQGVGNIGINTPSGGMNFVSRGTGVTVSTAQGNIDLESSGTVTMDSTVGAVAVTLNAASTGNITVHATTGDLVMLGGVNGALITAASGDITLTLDSGNLTLEGYPLASAAQTKVFSQNGSLTVTALNGDVTVGSTSQQGSSILGVNGTNPISVNANNITVQGGTVGSSIQAVGTTVPYDFNIMNLQATNNITLGDALHSLKGDLLIWIISGSAVITAGNALSIYGGTTTSGDLVTSILNSDSNPGSLTVSAGSFLLEGGPTSSVANGAVASIVTQKGDLTMIVTQGNIELNGASSPSVVGAGRNLSITSTSPAHSSSLIWQASNDSNISNVCGAFGNIDVNLSGGIQITGGTISGGELGAFVVEGATGNVSITLQDDLLIDAVASRCLLGSVQTGSVTLNVRDLSINGGSDPLSGMSMICAYGGGTGNIDITARNITLQGGSGNRTSPNVTGIQVGKSTMDTFFATGSGGNGTLTIHASGDVTLDGGTGDFCGTYIGTFGSADTNDVIIECANLYLNGSPNIGLSNASAEIFTAGDSTVLTSGGSITITSGNNVALTGTPNNPGAVIVGRSNPSSTYDIQMIAGNSLSMDAGSSTIISTLGTKDINLVIDNAPPYNIPPNIGPGTFQSAGDISTSGGNLHIFSSTLPQTTITGTLNGLPFDPTTEVIIPQWFSTFPGGGPPIAVYLKSLLPPPPKPTPTPVVSVAQIQASSAFNAKFAPASTQAFIDWDYFRYRFFSYVPYRIFYRKTGEDQTSHPISPDIINDSVREEYRNYNTFKLD